MQKNIDYVVYKPERESSWNFYTRGKAAMLSEAFNETLEITSKILEITSGFFIPTDIRYYISIEQGEMAANHVFRVKPIDRFDREIKSDQGISLQELKSDVQSIETPEGSVKMFRRITLNGRTRFILKGKDEYIDDRSRGLYAYHDNGNEETLSHQQLIDSPHLDYPLSISIQRSPSKGGDKRAEETDPAYYQLHFLTSTDIWFEKTEIGLANRNRLQNVFKQIYTNFYVVDTSFISDWFSSTDLEKVVYGND